MELGSGESIVVKMHPLAEIGEKPGKFLGSTTYSVPVVLMDGRRSFLAGGARLISKIQTALAPYDTEQKVRVEAVGDAGTTSRDWTITVVP